MVFVIHIAAPNPDGAMSCGGYVSNSRQRAELVQMIRETADAIEAKMDVAPGLPIHGGRA